MKTSSYQNSFSVGEIAPSLVGRTDIEQYKKSVVTLENFLILTAGQLKSCPGNEFINYCKYSDPEYVLP